MTSPANQNRPPLLLSRLDAERIEALIEQPQYRSLNTSALQDELARAEISALAHLLFCVLPSSLGKLISSRVSSAGRCR